MTSRLTIQAEPDDETQSHHLSRRHFSLVFLGATNVGGIEKTLCGSSRFRVEDRVDGRVRFSEIDRASELVLSPERNDDAFALHVETGLVRAGPQGMFGAESDRRSGTRSR